MEMKHLTIGAIITLPIWTLYVWSLDHFYAYTTLMYYTRNIILWLLNVSLITAIAVHIVRSKSQSQWFHQKMNRLLTGSVVSIYIILVVLITITQAKITSKQLPSEIYQCIYYDEYGNQIYTSRYMYTCSDLEKTQLSDDSVKFEIYEEIEHEFDDKIEYAQNKTAFIITYNDQHRFSSVTFQNSEAYIEAKEDKINSVKRYIERVITYDYNHDESTITMRQAIKTVEQEVRHQEDIPDYFITRYTSFRMFEPSDFSIEILRMTLQETQGTNKMFFVEYERDGTVVSSMDVLYELLEDGTFNFSEKGTYFNYDFQELDAYDESLGSEIDSLYEYDGSMFLHVFPQEDNQLSVRYSLSEINRYELDSYLINDGTRERVIEIPKYYDSITKESITQLSSKLVRMSDSINDITVKRFYNYRNELEHSSTNNWTANAELNSIYRYQNSMYVFHAPINWEYNPIRQYFQRFNQDETVLTFHPIYYSIVD